jgi:hypothetical protein
VQNNWLDGLGGREISNNSSEIWVMTQSLEIEIASFERVVAIPLPQNSLGRSVVVALRELYATKCAFALLRCARTLVECDIRTDRSGNREPGQFLESCVPSLESVQLAKPKLLRAVASQDQNGVVGALSEMGLFRLYEKPDRLFARLEFFAGSVIGRARLIPLFELAILAAETGSYDRAIRYSAEASALAPEPPELHDLHTVSGLVALAEGQVEKAKHELVKSVHVCGENEYGLLMCKIRPFNLNLAEKLLDCGEKMVVLKYLNECRRIWSYEAKRIVFWMNEIHTDQKPKFFAPGARAAMDRPWARMRDLTIRSHFLAETANAGRLDVDKILTTYKRDVARALKGKLGSHDN